MGIPESVIPVRARGHEFRLAAWLRDAGDDMVLFVHGLGCSKENFRDAWQRSELRGWTLLAIDLPGFGRSRVPDGFDCDLEAYARVVASVIDLHATRRIHLVAHSMGGTLSLLMPRRAIAGLESLVLVEARLDQRSSSVARVVSELDYERFRADFLPKFKRQVASDPRAAFDAERADPRAFFESSRSMSHWLKSEDFFARFAAIGCPKTFVYGADNQHLAELRSVPEAEQTSIAAAAHFVMQDQPDAFFGFLGDWLSRQRKNKNDAATNR